MFFKVIKNNKIIDLVQNPKYIKYQKKHNVMLLCDENEAEGIVSSDGNHYWHVEGFPTMKNISVQTVSLVEIDEYEFNQLKILNGRTIEEILDAYTLSLVEGGIL